jgi:regulator of protease activity HflC (stomatin/prohibitin superfamily)/uncharacterized membrane protein YeaQ/YmgE (transglycosylase-associated protein family)
MNVVMFPIMVLAGVLIGWLAGFIMERGGYGLKWDIVLGLAGSAMGSWIFWALGPPQGRAWRCWLWLRSSGRPSRSSLSARFGPRPPKGHDPHAWAGPVVAQNGAAAGVVWSVDAATDHSIRRRHGMGGFQLIVGIVPVVVLVIFVIATSVRILREYERAVIFRFGRRANAVFNPGGDGSGPGLVLLIPLVDKLVKVSLRTVTMDVPPQDVITRDNVSVKVNAVIFFRVLDATKAVISVEDYLYATSQIAQTTLRSVLGQQELDDLLASRDKINAELTRIIDQHTSPWGVKVATVEVKNVDLPHDMQRAMSKQAEAERERRAKVINAEGEFQAAAKLAEAAEVLSRFPIAVQLRYLQTMREVASERNTTSFFPLPLDLFAPLLRAFSAAEPPKS